MIVPTWVIVTGVVFFYAFVGFAEAVVFNFRAGKRGRGGVDGPEGVWLIFLWPIWNLIWTLFWVVECYDTFLRAVRKRGQQSVMPPENECQGRRIDP